MSSLINELLANISVVGSAGLAVVLMIGALGVPIPMTMLAIGAGALVQRGLLDWQMTLVLVLAGLFAGDSGSFWLGRRIGRLLHRRWGARAVWQRAHSLFCRRGGAALVMTRVVLTPLAAPTNFVAGSSRYAYRRFALFALVGEVLWLSVYGGLGMLFARNWQTVAALLDNLMVAATAAIVLIIAGAWLVRRRIRHATPQQVPATPDLQHR